MSSTKEASIAAADQAAANQNDRLRSAADSRSSAVVFEMSFSQMRDYLLQIAEQDFPCDLHHRLDAADVVQQSLMEAYQGLADFRGTTDAELRGWLRKVLRRNIIDFRRHETAARRDIKREVSIDQVPVKREDLMDKQGSASAIFGKKEINIALRQAVSEMTPRRQDLVRLRYHNGYSFNQIAMVMRISPAAARQLWARTLCELRLRVGV